ncbi:hypothetical protein QWA_17895 [Alcaligenes faecalis subsp. faecalis NCIB 8687]|nr:hypothetical protein QWA_17895 [Alcaligenes faecalis subsp. faecalis NCIB 8687]
MITTALTQARSPLKQSSPGRYRVEARFCPIWQRGSGGQGRDSDWMGGERKGRWGLLWQRPKARRTSWV